MITKEKAIEIANQTMRIMSESYPTINTNLRWEWANDEFKRGKFSLKHYKRTIKTTTAVIVKEYDSITYGECYLAMGQAYKIVLSEHLLDDYNWHFLWTVVHELLHAARPDMRHGWRFDAYVKIWVDKVTEQLGSLGLLADIPQQRRDEK